jgi:hypothetical protein
MYNLLGLLHVDDAVLIQVERWEIHSIHLAECLSFAVCACEREVRVLFVSTIGSIEVLSSEGCRQWIMDGTEAEYTFLWGTWHLITALMAFFVNS